MLASIAALFALVADEGFVALVCGVTVAEEGLGLLDPAEPSLRPVGDLACELLLLDCLPGAMISVGLLGCLLGWLFESCDRDSTDDFFQKMEK